MVVELVLLGALENRVDLEFRTAYNLTTLLISCGRSLSFVHEARSLLMGASRQVDRRRCGVV